jgi:folylpolyglutamate synthase
MAFFRRRGAMATYRDAIEVLNDLQTNHSVLNSTSPPISAAQSLPQMREWFRRAGYDDMTVFDRLNIIHITGTKGKGSTCAFVQSILNQYLGKGIKKIGLYTSPHLKTVRERIRINGEPVSKEKYVKYLFEIKDRIESTESDLKEFPDFGPGAKPNYFRFMTILSFHVFMRENVDAAIYEVGIGGEYDSTNIICSPVATGVTSLGIDHTQLLGNTIQSIAWNKGGIYKHSAKALSVNQPEEGLKVLRERADEKKTDFQVVDIHPDVQKTTLGLPASFQQINASLAVQLAADYLSKTNVLDVDTTKPIPEEFVQGLEKASWPGRCQVVPDGKVTWHLDGAHTTESLVEAAKWFADRSKLKSNTATKRVLVFNQQNKDKRNIEQLLRTLHDELSEKDIKFDLAIFTTNVTWSTGAYSAELTTYSWGDTVDKLEVQKTFQTKWNELDGIKSETKVTKSVQEAVDHVRSLNEPAVDVLVTGSLHLVGGLLTVLEGEDDE